MQVAALDREGVLDRSEPVGQRRVETLGMAAETVGGSAALSHERVLELLKPGRQGFVDAVAVGGDGGDRLGGDRGEAGVDRLDLSGQARDGGAGVGDEALLKRLGMLAERAGGRLGVAGELLVHRVEMAGKVLHRAFGNFVQPLVHRTGVAVERGQRLAGDVAELRVHRLAVGVERCSGLGRAGGKLLVQGGRMMVQRGDRRSGGRKQQSLELGGAAAETLDGVSRHGVEPLADRARMPIERGERVVRRRLQALVHAVGVLRERADGLLRRVNEAFVHGVGMVVQRSRRLRGEGVELVVHRVGVAGKGGHRLIGNAADALLQRVGVLRQGGDRIAGGCGQPLVHVDAVRGQRLGGLGRCGGDPAVEILVVRQERRVGSLQPVVEARGVRVERIGGSCRNLTELRVERLRAGRQRRDRIFGGGGEAPVHVLVMSDKRGIGRLHALVETGGVHVERARRLRRNLGELGVQRLSAGRQRRDRILGGGGETPVHVLVMSDKRGIGRLHALVEAGGVHVERTRRLCRSLGELGVQCLRAGRQRRDRILGGGGETPVHVLVMSDKRGIGGLHALVEAVGMRVERPRRFGSDLLHALVQVLSARRQGRDRILGGCGEAAVHLLVVSGERGIGRGKSLLERIAMRRESPGGLVRGRGEPVVQVVGVARQESK